MKDDLPFKIAVLLLGFLTVSAVAVAIFVR